MKSFKVIEATIIGSLIGVVVSVYILFMDTSSRDVGSILKTISLNNLLIYLPEQYANSIIFNFFFYIVVYTVYILILNFLFRIHKKIIFIGLFLIFLLSIGISVQQIRAFRSPVATTEIYVPEANISSEIKKYFGQEVKGDLNNDQIEDIAFLMRRNDGDGMDDMYYLSASLKTNQGYEGLNLKYIGQKINIKNLFIQDGVIGIEYTEEESEEIIRYKFKLEDNNLVEFIEDEESVQI